jgi:hypothetical protein
MLQFLLIQEKVELEFETQVLPFFEPIMTIGLYLQLFFKYCITFVDIFEIKCRSLGPEQNHILFFLAKGLQKH